MNEKNVTARIVVNDPQPKDLENHLAGRKISQPLIDYLQKVIMLHKGGVRKINIPSTHDDVGVVLLVCSSLEETHLQIHDELHVFFSGRIVVIKWEVRGKEGQSVPDKEFSVLGIKKVIVEGEQVTVTLNSESDQEFTILVDFALYTDKSTTFDIEHPLNQRPA